MLILFLIVTLYWGLGDSANPADATSIAAILFMCVGSIPNHPRTRMPSPAGRAAQPPHCAPATHTHAEWW